MIWFFENHSDWGSYISEELQVPHFIYCQYSYVSYFSPSNRLLRKSSSSGFDSSCPKILLNPTSVKGLMYFAISHYFGHKNKYFFLKQRFY